MLPEHDFKEDIEEWITNWVSVYNPGLEAVPCPFAKGAMMKRSIQYLVMESKLELDMRLADISTLPEGKEVIAIGIDPDLITADDLRELVQFHNYGHFMDEGLITLEDHPDALELINGVKMNQGVWAIVLIQSSVKLHEATQKLRAQGYYKNWTPENIKEVVSWRP